MQTDGRDRNVDVPMWVTHTMYGCRSYTTRFHRLGTDDVRDGFSRVLTHPAPLANNVTSDAHFVPTLPFHIIPMALMARTNAAPRAPVRALRQSSVRSFPNRVYGVYGITPCGGPLLVTGHPREAYRTRRGSGPDVGCRASREGRGGPQCALGYLGALIPALSTIANNASPTT